MRCHNPDPISLCSWPGVCLFVHSLRGSPSYYPWRLLCCVCLPFHLIRSLLPSARGRGKSYAEHEHEMRTSTCEARTVGVMASGGRGRKISTLEAEERSLNWLRALTRYSVRLRLCFSTVHSTQISGRTFWLSRYVLCSHGPTPRSES